MSRNKKASGVFSKNTRDNMFDQTDIDNVSLFPANRFNFNGAQFGETTVSELIHGAKNANPQSALMQLLMATILPINTVLTSTDSANPFGSSQFSEQIIITVAPTGSTVDYITVYGIDVSLEIGDDANTIAGKIFDTLFNTVAPEKDATLQSSKVFDMVTADYTGNNDFTLKHRSSRPHTTEYTTNTTPEEILSADGIGTGIFARTVVSSDTNGGTSLGYGEWDLFYTDSASVPDTPIYHYRRTA